MLTEVEITLQGKFGEGDEMRAICILLLAAIMVSVGVAANDGNSVIDEAGARALAIEQYHRLFLDKYFFNPVDRKHHKFPKLDAKFFHKVEIKDGCWQLAGDPPAGIHVYAKVSLDAKFVQLTRVGFAPE